MKLTAERDALLSAVERAARVIERRNTIPVLATMKVVAEKGRLVLTGTDLDMEVTTTCPAEVAQAGGAAMPLTAVEFLKKLPAGAQVEITSEKGRATLKAGRSRATLNTLDVEDFPELPAVAGEAAEFPLAASSLAAMIDRVSFAISTEETRYYLNGIYLHGAACEDGPLLRAVATDGHRLALHNILAPEGASPMPGVIVPRKAVAEIARLIKPLGDEKVTLRVSPTRLSLTAGVTTLATKLIDGTFPDYDRVIPKDGECRALVDAAALDAAVARVSTVSGERGRAVKFAFAAGLLTLSVTNPDTGEARDEVEAEWSAPPLEIGFNAGYVADILGALPGKAARLAMKDPGSPCLITAEGDTASLFVLMPMRV
jgi:DNA polymerase-3 subunit beta